MRAFWDRTKRWLAARLWVKPALASVGSVALATLAFFGGRRYDGFVAVDISEDSLVSLLGIFASSMLTVATFTVTAINTAAQGAAGSLTPRASKVVLADTTAQMVMSAFIAAFIYSVMGILALKAFRYGPAGRFLLFLGLIAIVGFVLVAFINWVDHALKLGRHSEVLAKLKELAIASITPDNVGVLGADIYDGIPPANAAIIFPVEVAYVVDLDVERLDAFAQKRDLRIVLATRPGELLDPTQPVAYVLPSDALEGDLREDVEACVLDCIETDDSRNTDRDIRLNILNLAELADRALSPGVNDPGSAIAVLNIYLAIFSRWALVAHMEEARRIKFARIAIPPLLASELVNDAFTPIARDGAGLVEVGIRLQKVLAGLARLGDAALQRAATEMSAAALTQATRELSLPAHVERIRRAAEGLAQKPLIPT